MRRYSFTDNGRTFERATKPTARRAYLAGLDVAICPANLRPGAPWHPEYIINRRDRAHLVADEIGAENDFENLVASLEYYNCRNSETGPYAAFYVCGTEARA